MHNTRCGFVRVCEFGKGYQMNDYFINTNTHANTQHAFVISSDSVRVFYSRYYHILAEAVEDSIRELCTIRIVDDDIACVCA